MFTGLVETIGEIAAVEGDDRRGVRFLVATPLAAELADGDSIAVNGVCLTAREVEGDRFAADVMAETLRRSSLGPLGEGDRVNLELPLRPDGRLGGHVVQGHVDGVSLTVSAVDDLALEVSLIPETLARTTLGAVAPGRPVNLEVDVLAKYVEKLMSATVEAP